MIKPESLLLILGIVLLSYFGGLCRAAEFAVERSDGSVRILADHTLIAEYVYLDSTITRPYFAHLHSPAGVRVSRNHPPLSGEDRMDHGDFHPGLWLAFGDLSGADNWRLKARVTHERFLQEPEVRDGVVSFSTENGYWNNAGDKQLCLDRSRYTLRITQFGALLTWDSTFFGDEPFWFGDQEEMGLGLRVATQLRVEKECPDPAAVGTGEIIDSGGRLNAAEVWGKSPNWLNYHGQVEGTPAGVALFVHPGNFRPSRMHARDYGFVAANPFALAAFGAAETSRVAVESGESLRLRYGILLHSGQILSQRQLEIAYQDYLRIVSP